MQFNLQNKDKSGHLIYFFCIQLGRAPVTKRLQFIINSDNGVLALIRLRLFQRKAQNPSDSFDLILQLLKAMNRGRSKSERVCLTNLYFVAFCTWVWFSNEARSLKNRFFCVQNFVFSLNPLKSRLRFIFFL